MRGQMMDLPLLISGLLEYGARTHARQQVVTRTVEGPVVRHTFRQIYERICQLAHALDRFGIHLGDRIGTMAWNTHRHLELYYGVSSIGAVCHMINPRLFDDQLVYVINHAEDRLVFVDINLVGRLEKVAAQLPHVEAFVVMTDREHMPTTSLPNVICYEDFIAGLPTHYDWPSFDEHTASSMCYTSGTTGNPKGVLYSHRSTVLHTYGGMQLPFNLFGVKQGTLMVVPMFHVNAWGLPYTCWISGTRIVMPGARLDGASVYDLIQEAPATNAWGVPTVWLGLLAHMQAGGLGRGSLDTVLIGGSAAPAAMIEAFEKQDISVVHGWGMTEMSPLGTTTHMTAEQMDLPASEQWQIKTGQGRFLFGVEGKIVDEDGKRLPHDGQASGELLVRANWVTNGYFRDEEANRDAFDAEGWFRTGDVATIDPEGQLLIVDRAKDVIKSGGEWISSIDLENAAMGHSQVLMAAVIAAHHPRWTERPLLIVQRRPGSTLNKDEILTFLVDKVAKWWLPDDIVFVDTIPIGATGKMLKSELRRQFRDYVLPTAASDVA